MRIREGGRVKSPINNIVRGSTRTDASYTAYEMTQYRNSLSVNSESGTIIKRLGQLL